MILFPKPLLLLFLVHPPALATDRTAGQRICTSIDALIGGSEGDRRFVGARDFRRRSS